jgi:uncharacterized ferritin-like protein (DUF455 family)
MAIRIREVKGKMIALCAVESDPQPGDIYLDDRCHYALSMKFWRDFCSEERMDAPMDYPEEWELMDTQKLRDAKKELEKWLEESTGFTKEGMEVIDKNFWELG